jgi:hypothetical protein
MKEVNPLIPSRNISHSFSYYALHVLVAFVFLSLFLFSGNISSPSFGKASVFLPEKTAQIHGEAYQKKNFETQKVKEDTLVFGGESFEVLKGNEVNLSFSDFTVVRTDAASEKTVLSVQESAHPEIYLESGKIWVSTKEYVVSNFEQAKVETLAGSVSIEKNAKGKIFITAWDNPSRVTLYSVGGEKLWGFLLPTRHTVEFSPEEFFSKKDFDKFRFSKLKKEFYLQKAEKNKFIKKNIEKDEIWRKSVIQSLSRKNVKSFSQDVQESFFALLPNTIEEQKALQKDQLMTEIWNDFSLQNFVGFTQKVQQLSAEEQKIVSRYAGFYPDNLQANFVFAKSFSEEAGTLWQKLWILESLVKNKESRAEQEKAAKAILEEMSITEYDGEEVQFFALSLFQNYSDIISYAIIDFFYDINSKLIEDEDSDEKKLLRKLEIIQGVFLFTSSLVEEEKYILARKILDEVEVYIINEENPVFQIEKEKIIEQKSYIRGKVEYSEILGDEEGVDLDSWLSIREQMKEHGKGEEAPTEDRYAIEKIKTLLKENDISHHSLVQNKDFPQYFTFEQERNKNGIFFSGHFNADTQKFSQVIFFDGNQNPISIAQNYVFSLEEMSLFEKENLNTLIEVAQKSGQKDETGEEAPQKVIPSEIADFVETISLSDFIAADITALSRNVHPKSIKVAEIESAVAHEAAREIQKKEMRKGGSIYEIEGQAQEVIEDYTFDFSYNIETKKASDIVLYTKNTDTAKTGIVIGKDLSLEEMVKTLDGLAKKERLKEEEKKVIVKELRKAGISLRLENIVWKDDAVVTLSEMKDKETRVLFNGEYNPKTKTFSFIELLNIAADPIKIPQSTSLNELAEDFETRADFLKEKVKEFK